MKSAIFRSCEYCNFELKNRVLEDLVRISALLLSQRINGTPTTANVELDLCISPVHRAIYDT